MSDVIPMNQAKEKKTTSAEGGERELQNIDLEKLNQKQVHQVYARLAVKGKTICARCKGIFKINDCVVAAYKGNFLIAACPDCLPHAALVVHKVEQGLAVGLINPKNLNMPGQIVKAPANVELPPLSSVLGPTVTRREY